MNAYFSVDLRNSDSGLYTCMAISNTGLVGAQWSARLDAGAGGIPRRAPTSGLLPPRPSRPAAHNTSASSITLEWQRHPSVSRYVFIILINNAHNYYNH